jgi:hypothetical protein
MSMLAFTGIPAPKSVLHNQLNIKIAELSGCEDWVFHIRILPLKLPLITDRIPGAVDELHLLVAQTIPFLLKSKGADGIVIHENVDDRGVRKTTEIIKGDQLYGVISGLFKSMCRTFFIAGRTAVSPGPLIPQTGIAGAVVGKIDAQGTTAVQSRGRKAGHRIGNDLDFAGHRGRTIVEN